MRFLLFLSFIVCGAFAQGPISYAGTTAGAATWTAPAFDSSTSICSADTTNTGALYVSFNVTFTSGGVWEVAAMAEKDFRSHLRIFVYSGPFSSSTPCGNILGDSLIKQFSLDGGPVIDDFVYFAPNVLYTFIVTGNQGASGLFAVNINPSTATGILNPATIWPIAYNYSDDSSSGCTTDSDPEDDASAYGTYTWTQATTGYYDIYALFYNVSLKSASDFPSSNIALYQGNPLDSGIQTDPCNNTATNATFLIGLYQYDSTGVFIPHTNLVAGTTYTVVFSGEQGSLAYWGVQIIPTRIRFFQQSSFNQPSRGQTVPCSADESDTSASWDSVLFTATEYAYLIDTSDVPDPFVVVDTYSFLYLGNNLGSSLLPPSTCPILNPLVNQGDTGDVTPVYALTIPGQNYTVVVSTYSGEQTGTDQNYAYILYLFTGKPIGSLPPPTGTTNSATTSPRVSTTSSGATLMAPFALLVITFFAFF